jgi:CDP-diacylglycerol--serine O-phosphatidyltransferase
MRRRLHSKRLSRVSLLPTLLTLGNLLCGFAAIHFVAKYLAGADVFTAGHVRVERWLPTHLAIAGYLILASMVFDALDGRVARLTRKTSDFGGQLDSLADVVSFGVAPAFLLIGLISKALAGDGMVISPGSDLISGRIVWILAAIYVCCGALRLARFNVENVHDESSHIAFKGLPIPGAAALVASLVILHEEVLRRNQDSTVADVLLWAMPLITLAAGMLMVSRIRYAHIANRYLRGRRPWGMIFWFLLLLAVFVVYPQMVMVIITASYAVSGPIGAAYRRFVPVAAGEGPVAVGGLHEPSDDGRRGEAIKPPSDSMRP